MKRSSRQRKRKLTRAEQIEEADAIRLWLFVDRGFALDMIATIAKRFKNEKDAQAVFRDLVYIVLALTTSAEPSDPIEMWERYEHHFVDDNQRKAFFSSLRPITHGIASARLYGRATRRAELWAHLEGASIGWDSSLLPPDSEPYVVHLVTLYPGILEEFLPRFFAQMRKSMDRTSTFMRALQIVQAVSALGWAHDKHTENLIKLKALRPSQIGSLEMVKKFIRDLRKRYPKHF